MGNFKIKSIWENKNTGGGNVPADLQNRLQAVEQKASTNETSITNLNNSAVKTTGDQSIAGIKTFTNQIRANEGLTTDLGKSIISGNLELGYGQTSAFITPEDSSNKTLKFGGNNKGRFTYLDFENQSRLMGIADPTSDYHAANKKYVDGKFKYIRKINQNGFTINANAYQSAEYTINGLTTGLNEFYIVLTTSSVDIGFEVKIQCNNLNYPNMSEIKTISTSNFTNSNVDNLGTILVGFVVYGNNKFRFRMKNNHSTNITFNGYRVYHRIPGALADS